MRESYQSLKSPSVAEVPYLDDVSVRRFPETGTGHVGTLTANRVQERHKYLLGCHVARRNPGGGGMIKWSNPK